LHDLSHGRVCLAQGARLLPLAIFIALAWDCRSWAICFFTGTYVVGGGRCGERWCEWFVIFRICRNGPGGDTPRCVAALGLRMPCSEEQLKEAYRAKVKVLHPDHGGDKRRFLWLQSQFEEALALLESEKTIESDALIGHWKMGLAPNRIARIFGRNGGREVPVPILQHAQTGKRPAPSFRKPSTVCEGDRTIRSSARLSAEERSPRRAKTEFSFKRRTNQFLPSDDLLGREQGDDPADVGPPGLFDQLARILRIGRPSAQNRQARFVLNRTNLFALGRRQLERIDDARIIEGTNKLLLYRDLPEAFQLVRA